MLLNADEVTGLNMIFLLKVKLVRLIVQQFINTELALNFGHAEIGFLSLRFKAIDTKGRFSQNVHFLPFRWTIFFCGIE